MDLSSRDVDEHAAVRVALAGGDVAGDGVVDAPTPDLGREHDTAAGERDAGAELGRLRAAVGDLEVVPQRRRLLGVLHRQHVVGQVELELAVIPPVAPLADVDGAEHPARARELRAERLHAIVVRPRRLGGFILGDHHRHVRILRERERHPKVRIGVHLRLLARNLGLELVQQRGEHLVREGEGAQGRADGGDGAEGREEFVSRLERNLLHLRRLARVVDGDEAVLVQALERPLLLGGHRAHLCEDVGVVGTRREMTGGWDEDLIAPEHGASTGAVGGVAAGLPDDRLEDGELAGHARGDFDEGRELDPGLVVVLGAGKRRESGALAGGVIDADGAAAGEHGVEIRALERRLGLGLGVRVERAESVAGAVGGPVLVHRDDDRAGLGGLPASRLEALLPVRLLRGVAGADDDGVEALRAVHLLHRGGHAQALLGGLLTLRTRGG